MYLDDTCDISTLYLGPTQFGDSNGSTNVVAVLDRVVNEVQT